MTFVNLGFHSRRESFVRVQVVYDERLPLDNYEGVDVTHLTKELSPKSPYELNVMHITVDGKPIDDLDRSSSDTSSAAPTSLSTTPISNSTWTISNRGGGSALRRISRRCS